MKKLKFFSTLVVASMSLMLCGCVNKNAIVTVNGDAITRSQYEKAFDAVADNSMFAQMGIDLKKDENSFLHLMLKERVINELKSTPIYHTNLISYLAASTNITNYELLENSITLSFNNHLLANLKDEEMLEEVKYSIALSMRDSYGVEEVLFNFPDSETEVMALS